MAIQMLSECWIEFCNERALASLNEHQSSPPPMSELSSHTSASVRDFSSPERSPSPSPSSLESDLYYAGLPSQPRMVGRSDAIPWKRPTSWPRKKRLGNVGWHPIAQVWEPYLYRKIVALLNRESISWTSIDVIRIGYVDEPYIPVVVWIGVKPGSITLPVGTEIARRCRLIIHEFAVPHVEVELRESSVSLLKGPKLLASTYPANPTVEVRRPLSSSLGLPISCKKTPWIGGTGGFFMAEGGDSKRILLITARHVVMEPGTENSAYEYFSSAPRLEVMLLGTARHSKFLDAISSEIEDQKILVEYHSANITRFEGMSSDDDDYENVLQPHQLGLAAANKAIISLNEFHHEVMTQWSKEDDRVLGHVLYSPPLQYGVGETKHTQDFAVISVDSSKLSTENFKGNIIDLGTKMSVRDFTKSMYPNFRNLHSFKYPLDRQFRLQGTISDQELRQPSCSDQFGEPCIAVLKDGSTTGLTIGHASEIRSIVRDPIEEVASGYSLEWTIICAKKYEPFSARGDSGAVIADGRGRIGGLLTGGTGTSLSRDLTYATPITPLLKAIKTKFPNAHLNPELVL